VVQARIKVQWGQGCTLPLSSADLQPFRWQALASDGPTQSRSCPALVSERLKSRVRMVLLMLLQLVAHAAALRGLATGACVEPTCAWTAPQAGASPVHLASSAALRDPATLVALFAAREGRLLAQLGARMDAASAKGGAAETYDTWMTRESDLVQARWAGGGWVLWVEGCAEEDGAATNHLQSMRAHDLGRSWKRGARRLQNSWKSAKDPEGLAGGSTPSCVVLRQATARAFAEREVLEACVSAAATLPSELDRLVALYALTRLQADMPWLLTQRLLSLEAGDAVAEQVSP
jgi:hypothetical protein